MNSIPKNIILQFNESTFHSLRKEYNLDKPGAMDQVLDVLEQWVNKQNHFLKKDFSRDYLERRIILSKGSVEHTKRKIDRLCTLKTLMPSFFEVINYKTDFKDSDIIQHALLPKLTNEHHRVYFLRNSGKRFNNEFTNYFRFIMAMSEYVLANDYCNGFILILEYLDVNFIELLKTLDILELRQAFTIYTEGYGMRVKGIHIVTQSKAADTFVSILKSMLSAKVGGRIQIHKDKESLHSCISKEILPVEYGGTERSLKKLHDEWSTILSSSNFQEYLNIMNKAGTNERFRQKENFYEDYIGMPGTFKSLVVD